MEKGQISEQSVWWPGRECWQVSPMAGLGGMVSLLASAAMAASVRLGLGLRAALGEPTPPPMGLRVGVSIKRQAVSESQRRQAWGGGWGRRLRMRELEPAFVSLWLDLETFNPA